MGFNSENADKICFDIETCALDDAADYLEPAEAPSNYKDPVKIAAAIAEKQAENLSKCSLDVDLCRIVAIGWWSERDPAGPNVLLSVQCAEGERSLLRRFWAVAANRHLVGYGCLGFDLPVLLRRSLYLGIDAPRIQIDRFKHPQVTDVMDELSYGGKLKWRGLSFFCKRFGIDIPDTMTGADIELAVKEERWDDIARHVSADVQKTAALAQRLGYFHPAAEAVTA